MEHAVGADHLIYGWFFFALVIIMLLAIGEWIRHRENKALKATETGYALDAGRHDDLPREQARADIDEDKDALPATKDKKTVSRFYPNVSVSVIITLAVLILFSLWQAYRMTTLMPADSQYPLFSLNANTPVFPTNTLEWSPNFVDATEQYQETYQLNGNKFDVFYAYFDGSDGELVSSLHRLYQQDRWTLTQRERTEVGGMPMLIDNVTSSIGIKRSIYYFYIVDRQWMISKQKAKLQQVLKTLQGEQSQGAIVAVSFVEDDKQRKDHTQVLEFVQSHVNTSFLDK
jgi:EpsI family protein